MDNKLTKDETGGIGTAIIVICIFVYGIKTQQKWKYWVFTMLFLTSAGYLIGSAFGANPTRSTVQKEEFPIIGTEPLSFKNNKMY